MIETDHASEAVDDPTIRCHGTSVEVARRLGPSVGGSDMIMIALLFVGSLLVLAFVDGPPKMPSDVQSGRVFVLLALALALLVARNVGWLEVPLDWNRVDPNVEQLTLSNTEGSTTRSVTVSREITTFGRYAPGLDVVLGFLLAALAWFAVDPTARRARIAIWGGAALVLVAALAAVFSLFLPGSIKLLADAGLTDEQATGFSVRYGPIVFLLLALATPIVVRRLRTGG